LLFDRIITNSIKLNNIGGFIMKRYTKLSLLLIVLMLASLFTGCNKQEKDLLDAFVKSQEVLSLESTSEMEFNLVASGLDEETQVIFDGFVNQINDMKLTLSQKSVTNKDQTITKGKIDANIQLPDMTVDSSIWVDMDMSGDKAVLKEVFKLPSMVMGLIPGAAEKEYIILDFDSINEALTGMEEDMPEPISMDETMAIAMKYQDKFMDAFVEYIKNYDSDLSVVTKLDDKTVDGEKINYYQVKFDNDSFKDFLKYTTLSMLEDENIIPLFEAYMNELMAASDEEMPADLSMMENITIMIQKTKEFFDKIEELTILGEDGIVITYGINEDGYFVSEKGELDFLIDTEEFMALVAESVAEVEALEGEALMEANEALMDMPTPVFQLKISYDTKMNSINEDLEIVMPTTTEENSIDYMALLESLMPALPQDMELMIFLEDDFLDYTSQPILIDGEYFVATSDFATTLDASLEWNEATKEITMVNDADTLIFKTNSKQLLKNGEAKDLSSSIFIQDGVSFIPLRSVSEILGYTVEWDGEFQMISVYK
jgi:hypothetical protein